MIDKHVYAFLAQDGTIKIGISKSPNQRKKQIRTSSGKNIIDEFISESTPNAKKIESLIFLRFAKNRTVGEWFDNLSFKDVVLHMKFYDYSDQIGIY